MGNLETYQEKADVLIEALPYIQRFNRKIIVVKYGGSAMENPELQKSVIEDVVLLKLVGFKPIIVHGGGKEISRWIKKVGMQPEFVNGLRVTDEATMEIAEMVLNKVNKNLVRMIEELGVHAVGMDEHYNTFNINADDAACAIAKAIKADKLVFLSDVWGVCRNPEDAHSLISELTISEAKDMIADGTISGGMLPKIESCIDAIDNGVNRVHILNGKIPRCLLLEIFSNKGIGTAVMNDHERRYYHEDQ